MRFSFYSSWSIAANIRIYGITCIYYLALTALQRIQMTTDISFSSLAHMCINLRGFTGIVPQ